ncbi:hypothetical protein KHA80_22945 [Anaerobacillus sp. HL2]|nr:hypothetical protein KHA80_22945 [Anaerobacillus sp. HL2]
MMIKNKDLYMISGPFEIAQKLNIPMDQSWSYNFKLTEQNKKFHEIPYNMASLSTKSTLLGIGAHHLH